MVLLVGEAIRQQPADYWFERLEQAGIPAGPINRISEALADVQAQHRRMVRTIAGVPMVGSPVRLDGERADSDLPPPALGEHTADVLSSLALDQQEIERLRAAKVIG
jgi:formyl-CoA transferase